MSSLEKACGLVDRLPNWTYPFVGNWIGCPTGMALWSSRLDERWGTGEWAPDPFANLTQSELDALTERARDLPRHHIDLPDGQEERKEEG